ncbi:unnamed protein product [Amoebophrya sp. A25]|nr:unnamed protein product [Amoebophrya sp. A25]|eukprot:GSA25T00008509001.1
MLTSTFQFSLRSQVFDGLIALGTSNDGATYLAAATSAGKVLIHQPQAGQKPGDDVQFLNINKKITDIAVGALSEKNVDRDIIMVGTPSNVMAYDIEENAELFVKEISDGCTRLRYGRREPFGRLCLVGGHCSLQGYDAEGTELFWSVVGDTVSALAFTEGQDAVCDLLVATEDNEIAAFSLRGGSCTSVGSPITEVDVVTHLECISNNLFAYALKSGAVGVYKLTQRSDNWATRLWRMAAKHQPRSLKLLEVAGGTKHVVIGWSNGKVEVRNQMTGDLMYKETLSAANLAGVVIGRYRQDGSPPNIIALTNSGDVHGFLPEAGTPGAAPIDKKKLQKSMGFLGADPTAQKTEVDNEAYRTLLAERQSLQSELKSVEDQMRQMKQSGGGNQGLIPTDTSLSLTLQTSPEGLKLRLATSNYSVIRSVVIYAEHLFEQNEAEIFFFQPAKNEALVPISPHKNAEVTLKVQSYVGTSATSEQYHTFEQKFTLPKFSMFHHVTEGKLRKPLGNVKIVLTQQSQQRIWQWLTKNFINVQQPKEPGKHLNSQFVSLRKQTALLLETSDTPGRNGVQFLLHSDDLELAAEIIEDLANHLGVKELDAVASFPQELQELDTVLQHIQGHNNTRLRLTAEIADSSNLVKALVVKAEDYRILADMKKLRRAYQILQHTNGDMIAEHTKRASNYQELLTHLKKVNQTLQNAGRLRCGAAKSKTVQACRAAMKANNAGELKGLIQTGAK